MMENEQLGPYKIVRQLGRGGMGTVYEALHVETGDRAAVKLLTAPMANGDVFRERFEGEIETLKKLNHPNIVRLFGFGRQQGHLYYAMELVDGDSLENELERGRRFGWREVCRIGIDVCRALRHAHDRGVIHRDIKPGNLLLTHEGQTKLSDFGIARLFGNSGQTSAGSVLGTAEYMAPEQAEGRPVSPQSDLYSLGVVFYVLLTGRPLFRGNSLPEILHKQRFEKPEPVSVHVPEVPTAFVQIVAQLLEKDPRRRVPNATLLIRQLEAMHRALSLGPEGAEEFVVNDDPAAAGNADDDRPWHESNGQRTTRVATDLSDEPSPEAPCPGFAETRASTDIDQPPADLDATADEEPAGAKTGAVSSENATNTDDAMAKRTDVEEPDAIAHFTPVAPEELDQPETRPERPALISLQTWILAASFLAVGLAVWYFLQPPTADALYESISKRSDEGSIEALREAEPQIQRFLDLYAEDSRCDELLGYLQEIDLDRLERRFQLRAKGLASREMLLPVERAYLEAINYVRLDPERGMAKLQAMLDLYADLSDVPGPTGQCLELARRRLEQMHEEYDPLATQQRTMLQNRLDEARRIAPDNPDQARAIFLAAIELYQEKPWAAELVAEARAGLERIDATASEHAPMEWDASSEMP